MFGGMMQYIVMPRKFKVDVSVPRWAKILFILILLSLVFTIFAQVAESLIPITLLTSLILFPGPDEENPRLIRWVPALWVLSFAVALAFLIARWFGKELAATDSHTISDMEILSTLVFSLPLAWTLIKRQPIFKWLLLASTVVSIWTEYEDYLHSPPGQLRAIIELAGSATAEVLLAVYLLLKFRPGQKRC